MHGWLLRWLALWHPRECGVSRTTSGIAEAVQLRGEGPCGPAPIQVGVEQHSFFQCCNSYFSDLLCFLAVVFNSCLRAGQYAQCVWIPYVLLE